MKQLPIPIKAFGGKEDSGLKFKDLDGWSELTTSSYEQVPVSGDHFFLRNQAKYIILKMLS